MEYKYLVVNLIPREELEIERAALEPIGCRVVRHLTMTVMPGSLGSRFAPRPVRLGVSLLQKLGAWVRASS